MKACILALLLMAPAAGLSAQTPPTAPAPDLAPDLAAHPVAPLSGGLVATRIVQDDLGRRVEVPVDPRRIVSTDDVYLTIPLLELGITPAGSQGRPGRSGGAPWLRSGKVLLGADFENTGMVYLGADPVDPEAVVAARPDLILTLANRATPPEILSQIAPVVVVDLTRRSPRALYRHLAELTGRQPQLARLEAQYATGLGLLQRAIAGRAIRLSLFDATAAGKIALRHTYGALGEVMRDAGVLQPALIDRIPPMESIELSPEILPELDADIVIGTWRDDREDSPATARAALAAILPEYCSFLAACRGGRMYFLPRDVARSDSYAARMMMLSFLMGAVSALGD